MSESNETVTVSIIVPLYKEEKNVEKLVLALQHILDDISESYEIILIDDGSPDKTWATISNLSESYCNLFARRFARNFGKEAAIFAGLEIARGKSAIVMDGDMQHPPSLIPEMLRLWRKKNVDVVEAVKKNRENDTFISKIRSRLFYIIFFRLTGYDLHNASDFKLIDRRVLDALLRMQERNLFFRGMSAWVGFTREKIIFSVPEREHGKTKWSVVRLMRLAITAITSFSSLPIHIITFMGLCFSIFALLLAIHTIYMKCNNLAVSGFSTVIILLLIIGSILMIGMGIIGEYIARIYEEVKFRPRYIVCDAIERRHNKDRVTN